VNAMDEQDIPILTERTISPVTSNSANNVARPVGILGVVVVVAIVLLFIFDEEKTEQVKEAKNYGTGFESTPKIAPDSEIHVPFYTVVDEEASVSNKPKRTAKPRKLDTLDAIDQSGSQSAIGLNTVKTGFGAPGGVNGAHNTGVNGHRSPYQGPPSYGRARPYGGVDPAMRPGQSNEDREQLERWAASPVIYDSNSSKSTAPASNGYSDEFAMAMMQQQMAGQQGAVPGLMAEMMGQSGPSNPNLKFAEQQKRESVQTVRAMPTGNTDYRIAQGKIITATLETGINTTLPGMIRAVVSYPVYAETGRNVLLPPGSRLIGVYNSDVQNGQARVYVIWQRAIRPDGIDIELGSPGIDGLGRAGVAGQMDKHFIDRFSNAALLSLIGAGVSNLNPGEGATASESYKERMAMAFQNQASADLAQGTDIQPTNFIDQGSLIKVFCSRDMDFYSALANAELGS